MDYITRNLETVVEQVTKEYPVVLVTGPRPVSYTHLDVYKRQGRRCLHLCVFL